MMSNPVMVDEVNRLVAGLLLSEGGVFMPSVGSLQVERRSAKRLSKRSVLPPHRVVAFTSQPTGVSLVEAIVRAIRVAGGDTEQAEAIYGRWLSYVQNEGVVTIGGVGALQQKHMKLDPIFDKRLNPQGREPLMIKPLRRLDWAVWLGGAAILFVAGIGGYQYLMTTSDPAEKAVEVIAAVTRPEVVTESVSDFAEGTSQPAATAQPESQLPETISQSAQPVTTASQPAQPGELTAGRRYLVLGVFSTQENAERAAGDAATEYPGIQCRVYLFGAKWMVSCFESDDAAACVRFIDENRSRMPDLWTYTAK